VEEGAVDTQGKEETSRRLASVHKMSAETARDDTASQRVLMHDQV